MLKKFLFIALVAASAVACKSKTAFNYNESIVAKETALEGDIQATENAAASFMKLDEYDSIASVSQAMIKKVQATIDNIQATPAPAVKEGDNFKAAALRYFGFIRNIYDLYVKFGSAGSDEARQTVLADIQRVVADKPGALTDIRTAQQKFAEANGFKLQQDVSLKK